MIPVELTSTQRIKAELTDRQREVVAKARELAGLSGAEKIREHTGDTDAGMAYAVAFGEAQWDIRELLAIIAELTGAGK